MLIDTTLREGAQLFGAYFDLAARERIALGLLSMGVEEVELGWVGMEDLGELVRRVRPHAGDSSLSFWSPCREADIRKASSLSLDRINIGVPVSDSHIRNRLGIDRDGLRSRLTRTLLLASILGFQYISVGLEDVSRTDPDFALSLAGTAQDLGVSRIRLSDSLGLLSPPETESLVRRFRNELDVDLAVHCHDDFGMATGNALTALKSGADYADASLLGIGERSGIAATEELAAYLSFKEESHAYDIKGIKGLCTFVSRKAGIPVPRNKAVAGSDIFSCESGLHAHALSKSPELFEPYDPGRIGSNRRIEIGGKSGRSAVLEALDHLGLDCSEPEVPRLVQAVRELSWNLKRPLTSCELHELAGNSEKNSGAVKV